MHYLDETGVQVALISFQNL